MTEQQKELLDKSLKRGFVVINTWDNTWVTAANEDGFIWGKRATTFPLIFTGSDWIQIWRGMHRSDYSFEPLEDPESPEALACNDIERKDTMAKIIKASQNLGW